MFSTCIASGPRARGSARSDSWPPLLPSTPIRSSESGLEPQQPLQYYSSWRRQKSMTIKAFRTTVFEILLSLPALQVWKVVGEHVVRKPSSLQLTLLGMPHECNACHIGRRHMCNEDAQYLFDCPFRLWPQIRTIQNIVFHAVCNPLAWQNQPYRLALIPPKL